MKLTVVGVSGPCPNTGVPKFSWLLNRDAGGVIVVRLLRLWKHVWNVVPLVAPGVLIHRRVEDSVGSAQDNARARNVLRDPEAWSNVVLIGVHQALGISVLSADEHGRNAIVEHQIAVRVFEIIEGAGVFVTQSRCSTWWSELSANYPPHTRRIPSCADSSGERRPDAVSRLAARAAGWRIRSRCRR